MGSCPHPPACPVCQADVHPAMGARYEGACCPDHGLVMEDRVEVEQYRASWEREHMEEHRRMVAAVDKARDERDEARAERDRYRIQEAQQRVERIRAEGEARRLRAGLSTIRTDYPDAAQAVNAILWPMPAGSDT